MTNFEYIKAMNIEQMAEFLANNIPHGDCYGCGLCSVGETCTESWRYFLERKAGFSAFRLE